MTSTGRDVVDTAPYEIEPCCGGMFKGRARGMKASRTGRIVFLVLIAVAFLAGSIPGQGYYPARLPDKGQNFGCMYCHFVETGGGAVNSFGQDFKANGYTYDQTLGAKDPDRDGFTNQQEFDNVPVTNPGDSGSYPKTEGSGDNNNLFYFVLLVVVIAVILGAVLISRRGGAPASYRRGPKDRSKLSRRARRRSGRGRRARARR